MAEKEYIEKETVLKHFDEVMNNEFCDPDFKKASLGFSIYVSRLAAADVAPVRHGHWEQVDDTKCKCSKCESIAYIAQYPPSADKNYCPNCGAKMRGETI